MRGELCPPPGPRLKLLRPDLDRGHPNFNSHHFDTFSERGPRPKLHHKCSLSIFLLSNLQWRELLSSLRGEPASSTVMACHTHTAREIQHTECAVRSTSMLNLPKFHVSYAIIHPHRWRTWRGKKTADLLHFVSTSVGGGSQRRAITLYPQAHNEKTEREDEDPSVEFGDIFNWIESVLGNSTVNALEIADALASLFDVSIRRRIDAHNLFHVR